jgi:CheY-like chemotaxis protein/predicted regulator of Ras-like GTPase activity (Roadblock/LC7/MglB family)
MTRHILIVDDEPRVAFFLSKALEHASQDYQVSVAHSGEEALDILNRTPVDLLVTDLRMPGISGLELMRWVRASNPKTRTILITAYGNDEVEAEAHRLEAYRYITKPFSLDAFTQAAQEALRDMAVSQPGLVVLSDESYEALTRELESLCQEVGAQCIFLADMLGQRLAEVGITDGVDSAALLSLLAGGFATTGELARQFGGGEAANLNFHQGKRYEIYSANVGDNLFLAMLYERRVQSSRIGLVWLYTRRAIEHLLATLSTSAATPARSLNADFGSSLMAELDTLLSDSPPQVEPVRQSQPLPHREIAPVETHVQAKTPDTDQLFTETLGVPLLKAQQGKELLSMDDAIAQGIISPDLGRKRQ